MLRDLGFTSYIYIVWLDLTQIKALVEKINFIMRIII